jgi:hypothetical protein
VADADHIGLAAAIEEELLHCIGGLAVPLQPAELALEIGLAEEPDRFVVEPSAANFTLIPLIAPRPWAG